MAPCGNSELQYASFVSSTSLLKPPCPLVFTVPASVVFCASRGMLFMFRAFTMAATTAPVWAAVAFAVFAAWSLRSLSSLRRNVRGLPGWQRSRLGCFDPLGYIGPRSFRSRDRGEGPGPKQRAGFRASAPAFVCGCTDVAVFDLAFRFPCWWLEKHSKEVGLSASKVAVRRVRPGTKAWELEWKLLEAWFADYHAGKGHVQVRAPVV